MKETNAKTVYKPWGREVWLELNDRYCYKRIYINAGHRTSYQVHQYKHETNYLISGRAIFWLEDEHGVVNTHSMEAGEFFSVAPGRKHRVIAITDIILQEVSTPEVDDVIRLQDDTNSPDGLIIGEHHKPIMVILCAGTGSRMSSITSFIHKGLLPIDNRAAISHIIEKTPKDYDILIVVGYHADIVREYCQLFHKNRDINFVEVDQFEGANTGPGYSIRCCYQYLQRPFYLCTADCYFEDPLPMLNTNWLGVYPTDIPQLYSTVQLDMNHHIINFTDKSEKGYENAFIGLCYIKDYDVFWQELKGVELVSAFADPSKYSKFRGVKFNWYDLGTIDGYSRLLQYIPNISLP